MVNPPIYDIGSACMWIMSNGYECIGWLIDIVSSFKNRHNINIHKPKYDKCILIFYKDAKYEHCKLCIPSSGVATSKITMQNSKHLINNVRKNKAISLHTQIQTLLLSLLVFGLLFSSVSCCFSSWSSWRMLLAEDLVDLGVPDDAGLVGTDLGVEGVTGLVGGVLLVAMIIG